jgi:multimeric flavodoxin WrbA
MIHVLGICGSPIKDSNTELFLEEAFKALQQEDVATDRFTIQGKKIEDCRQCNWCMGKQTVDQFCSIRDDLDELFPKVVWADALLLATPVYLGRMSGYLASLLDRMRSIHYGKAYAGALTHKVGAALAVSWYRNSGLETALNSIHWAFMTFNMVIAVPNSFSTYGGVGLSSLHGEGGFDPKDKHQILKDEYGLKTARATAESLLELARIIKRGKQP